MFIFSKLYISLYGEGKVAHNIFKLVHNYLVNIRILFQLELDNFEVWWFFMLLELFDSTWGKVLS